MFGLSHEDRKQLRRGALRSYGRKYRWLIVFGPPIAKFLAVVLAVVGVYLVCWVLIPHWVLGTVALAMSGAAVLAWLAPKVRASGVRRRMLDRATGRSATPRLGWAYAVLALTGAGMGWLALWSPFT